LVAGATGRGGHRKKKKNEPFLKGGFVSRSFFKKGENHSGHVDGRNNGKGRAERRGNQGEELILNC